MARPSYDAFTDLHGGRASGAPLFARQALLTAGPFLNKPVPELDVLDLGCGYGYTARELARECHSVVGIEPMSDLYDVARGLAADVANLTVRCTGVEDLDDVERYDLVILDNVYEHLPDQALALKRVSAALRPGGALYLVVPNKLWPIEAHYRLPFLSWLPLPLANRYLRLSRRGVDYTDASYAPTLWRLRRAFESRPELDWTLTLPGDLSATMSGARLHYRLGVSALERFPVLWGISKAFLVVARKSDA